MAEAMISYQVEPAQALEGELSLPGDKSISHRALLLSAIAEGHSRIHRLLMGADNLATLAALQQLGVRIYDEDDSVVVEGRGLYGLKAPEMPLDLGNSGTGLRLLAGLLAAQTFSSEVTGDHSLCRRPMARIVLPLRQMGACITMSAQGTPPLLIEGGHALRGIEYVMPLASAQVKSSLLLAGLYAHGCTALTEPDVSRDHTERMLQQFSYPIRVQGKTVSLVGGGRLRSTEIQVPADISSAAFFMVAACITPGSTVYLKQVGINPTRTGIINILQAMGADITIFQSQTDGPEPTADIVVRYSPLHGIKIPSEWVVLALDEFPIIFIAAACARGVTELRDAHELRVKESDRIATMAAGLTRLGIHCEMFADGIRIIGGRLHGGEVDTQADHRIAMAFAVAGCVASDPIIIRDCANVATSFPNFTVLAKKIGIPINILNA